MVRYSIIDNKNPREIVLLRGRGCSWRKCTFCDYHLEVINSGSFTELDEQTIAKIEKICLEKKIHTLHFECHWLYRNQIPALRKRFERVGTTLKIKTGVESFDYDFRENFLKKGISEANPAKISEQFDECCLLFGLSGQTTEGMINDIETGLEYFERVCVNIFVENSKLTPDNQVIQSFIKNVMPLYQSNGRVDILLNNTDFGVGSKEANND